MKLIINKYKQMSKCKFYQSSITKKIFMSLTGLFLMTFLIVHAGINLFIIPITADHKEIYDMCVKFMVTNPLIKAMEIVLFGGLLLHFIYAFILQIKNWISRPTRYAVTPNSQKSFFSKYMIWTGILILILLCLHFGDFYFVKLGWVAPFGGAADAHDFYPMAVYKFSQPLTCVWYLFWFAILMFHFLHAFQSAFQSLGLNHSKYNGIIKCLGIAYSIIIPLMFAVIPIYFLLLNYCPGAVSCLN